MSDDNSEFAQPTAKHGDETSSVTSSDSKKKKEKEKEVAPQASISDTMGFALNCGGKTVLLFVIGTIAGIGNGLVFPGLAWLFSNSFSDLAAISDLGPIRRIAYYFMGFGAYALVMSTIQTACFEKVAYEASMSLRLKWFHALLRQDGAFFDVYDIAGMSSNINPSAGRYRRGLGRKFGEGIQFGITAVGGLAYAFFASWRVALVILAVIPLLAVTASLVVYYNQTKTTRAAESYSRAGSVAYSTVSAIRTVLSLNAVPTMIKQYTDATKEAYSNAIGMLLKQGAANGSMLGSFILLYCVLALYGTYLLYSDIDETGCDPTGGVDNNETCTSSGPDVFGAMLGVAFAGQGISQVGNALGTFTAARVATYEALKAINRTRGAPEEMIYEDVKEMSSDSTHSRKSKKSDAESGEKRLKAILPPYEIDSFSSNGEKPTNVAGRLTFENVHFAYPTRPGDPILKGLDIDIEAGKTVAFVGPSGGGKSTVVKLLERFYDPAQGSIKLDGVNIKDINVRHYRHLIGYVGQEPTLFATSIAQNIRYGNPSATQEQIEEAARLANAHDFISSFSEGYETQVGDKGTQLSGGQKQRIAIARVLVADPTILLLDEATSALDSESELVVQEALDNVLASRSRTTCIIAHRLSTIRNADVIAVVSNGSIVEKGTHDELMDAETGYYRKLVEKQDASGLDSMSRSSSATELSNSRENSSADLEKLGAEVEVAAPPLGVPVIEFQNVTFAYPTRLKKRILKDFNLQICKGETVALVGPSGGGKSTTVALIERFYDPLEGAMKYLDHDVKSLNTRWYRDQIGYVGQEPTLFNDTIANNIKYGAPEATREEIIEACKQSNAHDFIMTFPDNYDTMVGERGTQISGGQKQRIAIARALVKKPNVLLLDEATSALDNESEGIVQAALDELMASKDHTCVVIAHRLSTIRNATRIAFIADGHVKEFGSHEELMEKPKGRYRRLVESQKRKTTVASLGLAASAKTNEDKEKEDEEDDEVKGLEEAEKKAFDAARARKMASADVGHLLIGAVGAILSGGVFPMWGLLFAETIELLFRPVFPCDSEVQPEGVTDCDEYISEIVDNMRDDSFLLAIYWALVVVACVGGNMLTFYGFGVASERVNKRIRDQAFSALVRQEVAYFDKQSVGGITSRLQDDAARIHTFIGDPVRALLVALSSVVTGLVLSFIFMWPFALVGVACVPLMGFATSLDMKQTMGTDEGGDEAQDETNSPGGIIVETLLNVGTVSALTMEEARFNDFRNALHHEEPNQTLDAFKSGVLYGLSQFIQQWINALQFWWGGYVILELGGFDFNDFLVSNFALLFSLFGLGAAFQDISDKKETEASAGRIFYLFDRKSAIDPLSEDGKKLS